MNETRLTVDPILCDAYGHCAELLPELIEVDDWGYPIVSTEPVPARFEAAARRTVAACPRLALRLVPIPQESHRRLPETRGRVCP